MSVNSGLLGISLPLMLPTPGLHLWKLSQHVFGCVSSLRTNYAKVKGCLGETDKKKSHAKRATEGRARAQRKGSRGWGGAVMCCGTRQRMGLQQGMDEFKSKPSMAGEDICYQGAERGQRMEIY
jgi:hypothetical protein